MRVVVTTYCNFVTRGADGIICVQTMERGRALAAWRSGARTQHGRRCRAGDRQRQQQDSRARQSRVGWLGANTVHILGLDFATKTGVAYGNAGDPAARIATETWTLPSGGGEDVGPIMHALRNALHDRVIRGVELVVFEGPYVAVGKDYRGRTVHRPDQIRRAFGFAAICEEVCYGRGVKVIEVAPSTLKKEFALHGRAEKSDMIEAARRRGFTVANDHEADAAACWLHGVMQAAPQLLQIYDPIFIGGARP